MERQTYEIRILKKALKALNKIPESQKLRFHRLAQYLRENGPVAKDWPNYSRLSQNEYHCHLSYSYAACWRHEKGTITIEVYYVGSRENAPY